MMSTPSPSRFGRWFDRTSKPPSERAWERSTVLEPQLASRDPGFVSDGAGLPFAPTALYAPAGSLDPTDPAAAALAALLDRQKAPPNSSPVLDLEGWKVLARSDDEVLFGHGLPPTLMTIVMRLDARHKTWISAAVTTERPLRAMRDGIRASGWRIDPSRDPDPEDTIIRVLVTEQTFSGGTRADKRLLPPDLYLGTDELVLTMFVNPRPGFQVRSPNPETLARVALPAPIGQRQLIDGAIYDRATPSDL